MKKMGCRGRRSLNASRCEMEFPTLDFKRNSMKMLHGLIKECGKKKEKLKRKRKIRGKMVDSLKLAVHFFQKTPA